MYAAEKILVWSEKAGRYNTLPGVVPQKTPGKLQSLQICQQSLQRLRE
jgi:hypothetical protein